MYKIKDENFTPTFTLQTWKMFIIYLLLSVLGLIILQIFYTFTLFGIFWKPIYLDWIDILKWIFSPNNNFDSNGKRIHPISPFPLYFFQALYIVK